MWTGARLFQGGEEAIQAVPANTLGDRRPGTGPPKWAESWSQNHSGRNSLTASQDFQPLRSSQHGDNVPGGHSHYPYVDLTQSRPQFMPPIRAFRVPGDTPLYQHNQSVFATPAAAPLEHGVRASQQDASHHHNGRQLHYGQYGQGEEAGSRASSPGRAPSVQRFPHIHTGGDPGEQPDTGTGHHMVPSGTAVRLSRKDAWARFLAYEGAFQVCLRHLLEEQSNEARGFLLGGCQALRQAFAFDGLLLDTSSGSQPSESMLVWDDTEAILPTVGFGTQVTRTSIIKCTAARLECTGVHRAGRMKLKRGLEPPKQFIALRAALNAADQCTWTTVGPDGRGLNADVLELGADDREEELVVEVHNAEGLVASGTIPMVDLWQVAGNHFTGSSGASEPPETPSRRKGFLGIHWKWGGAATDDDIFGKKWVEVFNNHGSRYGFVLLSAWISNTEKTIITAAEIQPNLAEAVAEGLGAGGKGCLRITGSQVYDLTLEAALRAQSCGSRQLLVTGEWSWLLSEFAVTYGIRESYASLSHLRWVLRQGNATVTAYCLGLLVDALSRLRQSEHEQRLLPQEVAMMRAVEVEMMKLLCICFENYYSLDEQANFGMLDGGRVAMETPAPAMRPAVELTGLLQSRFENGDARSWLTARFQIAAVRRYRSMEASCDAQQPFNDTSQRHSSPRRHAPSEAGYHNGPLEETAPRHVPMAPEDLHPDVVAYQRLEVLTQAIKNELQKDLEINDAGVLPPDVVLPQITAAEYGRELIDKLLATLEQYPPQQPTRPAVDLLVAIGEQQQYLLYTNLLPPPGSPGALDALQVFGSHVERWIDGTQESLCSRCHQIEVTTVATAAISDRNNSDEGRSCVAPLVDEMLQRVASEVGRYERVVAYWPIFGPLVEGAVCTALRETTAAVTRQCGLGQVRQEASFSMGHASGPPGHHRGHSKMSSMGSDGLDRSPPRWQWKASAPLTGAARLTVLPHEAVLLNSLRRLLLVVPHTERTISKWAGGLLPQIPPTPGPTGGSTIPPSPHMHPGAREPSGPGLELMPDGCSGPKLGAQFAQLVKELRSEYAGAVTACALRIAYSVFGMPGRSILRALDAHGVSGTPAVMQQQIQPVLEVMEEVMMGLTRALDGRVYVAVGRGLWDFTAKEVYDYVEGLQEGRENKGAWRGRQSAAAALDVVDNFYSAVLSGTLQHDLQPKDLDLPLHSDRAHKLLADNTAAINTSYTVY